MYAGLNEMVNSRIFVGAVADLLPHSSQGRDCFRRWVELYSSEFLALNYPVGQVESQDCCSYFANSGPWDNQRALQLKVLGPMVGSRIEKPCELPAATSQRADVTPLGPIEERTSVRKVFGNRRAEMLLADDVIDLAPQIRISDVNQAILAKAPCACLDQRSKLNADVSGHCPLAVLALALANRIACSRCK